MMRTLSPRKAMFVAVLGLLAAGSVSAQSIVASTTEGSINQQNHGSTVVFTNTNPASIGAFNFSLTYDSTNLTITAADITSSSSGTACNVPSAGTILCFANPEGIQTLLPASITINLPFDIGAVEGVEALTFGATDVFDGDVNPVALDPTDGQITITAAPADVVLAFNPDPNVVFPGGTSGTVQVADIDVTVASGTVGTGTIDNCVLGGANPAAFTIVQGTASAPPADTIDLSVTLANAALSATLTCQVSDASATTQKVFQLSAPAGTPVPAPGFTSTPAPGSALTCNGQPGSVVNTAVTVTNNGFGAGPAAELTYTCTTSGAGFAIGSGGNGALAVGASAQVTVQCTVPAEDAPAIAGELNCTTNAAANPTVDYPITSVAVSGPPPIPQPNIVPASSLWSQISLIGLMAALGLLVVGIRRKG